jgi:putative ABC transport system permease protein
MIYALNTIVRELNRFLPAIITVAMCSMMMYLQGGLIRGILSLISTPVEAASADIWVAHPAATSLERGQPTSEQWLTRTESVPGVVRTEPYFYGNSVLTKAEGGSQPITILGFRLSENSLGALPPLTPAMKEALSEVGTVVVADSEIDRLGLAKTGYLGEVAGHRVRSVGWTRSLKGFAGPYFLCSTDTARLLLPGLGSEQATYVLAECHPAADPEQVAAAMRARHREVAVYTRPEFVNTTQFYWLIQTRAGFTIGLTYGLVVFVGLVVTSQTLYAVTAAARREYAVLDALGIPRWRMAWAVFCQSFWVGVAAVILALPMSFILAKLCESIGIAAVMEWWIIAGVTVITILTALISGVIAMRSLLLIEPAELLH